MDQATKAVHHTSPAVARTHMCTHGRFSVVAFLVVVFDTTLRSISTATAIHDSGKVVEFLRH